MKKKLLIVFLSLILFVGIGAALSSFGRVAKTLAQTEEAPRAKTFLLLGLDGAARNSDVAMLVRYDPLANRLVFLQLPRDTYLEDKKGTGGKLNRFHALAYAESGNAQKAAEKTAALLSEAFGITVDGCITVTFSALAAIVDSMGGIPMDLPFPMEYSDPEQDLHISLPKGPTVLDGEAALQFVRYRSGYTEGDLGRVDAQKLFLSAFLKQTERAFGPLEALKLLTLPENGLTVCFDFDDGLLPIIIDFYQKRLSVEKLYISLPGEAVQENGDSGTWYYVINRRATEEVLSTFFDRRNAAFDPDERFTADKIHFENIYFDRGFAPRIYTEEELEKIKILTKE